MPIRPLPQHLVNQIAAGEVIERPASVVKELVENALDAGGTRIAVDIEEGGSKLVRISDNGSGIPQEELPLAVAAHATSKIQTLEDLEAIATLGFRGEALASIASVSRFRITSRPPEAQEAFMIQVDGENIGEPRPTAAAKGTTIEVRDLFFNTPARRKFMRTAPTEYGHIADTVSRLAIVHPHVGFALSHNGRQTMELTPTDDRRLRAIELLGKDIQDGLLEFEHRDPPDEATGQPGACVWGIAALPNLARSNSKQMYLCINARSVKDRNLQHAVKEAYRGLMPPDKHPVAVVLIDMDPAMVDVNVHPTKAEVRFRNPRAIHGLVLSSIKQRLLQADLTPAVSQFGTSFGGNRLAGADNTAAPTPTPRDFVDAFKSMPSLQKDFVFDEVRREIAKEQPLLADAAALPDASATPALPTASSQLPISESPYLQVHSSYVVASDPQGILIIDQHALHERVMFEQLSQRVLGQGKPLESQRMLVPAVVKANTKQQALLESLTGLLEKIGADIAPISQDSVAVHAFPSFLFERKVDPVDFVEELLDKAENGDFDTATTNAEENALHNVLDMMSCKAAVKAGDKLTAQELEALLKKRDEIERAGSCPHGRPTQIRLSLRDLEKQFLRG